MKEKLRKIFLSHIVNILVKNRVNPNFITIFAFLLNFIPFYFYVNKQFILGGLSLLIVSLLDAIDGEVARRSNMVSSFGALLDSTLDRFSEAIVFLALIIAFNNSFTIQLLLILCAFGSFFISYIRARGEGLNILIKIGPMERPERIAFIFIMSFFVDFIVYFLVVFMALIYLTIILRIYDGYRKLTLKL